MAAIDLKPKRVQIDKANVVVVAAVTIAAFVSIFSLVAIKSLWSQRSYQSHVISARETARDQLKSNIDNAGKLTESYKQFVSSAANVIGGSAAGTGERDGDNARIVLDALPSKYDFPALASSLEKLIKGQGLSIQSIVGTDDELNQGGAEDSSTPAAVEMPFKLAISGDYTATQNFIIVLEKSIRPFVINQLVLDAGEGGTISMTIDAKTFYQPEKSLNVKSEVIK